MKVLLQRSSVLIVLALALASAGCHKNVPPPVAAPPIAPPPPPAAPSVTAAPTITLRADNTTITTGQSVTLTYAATNATAVTIAPGVGAVTPANGGTRQVSPTTLTTYTATATGPGGTASSAGVTITVNPRPPAAPAAAPPAAPPATRTPLTTIFNQTMVPILFDYDKSNIRAGEEPKLLQMASFLKQNANVRFTIEGHADERGGQEYNIALGDERAAAVRKYLAGQGVAENRMTVQSFGEEKPICTIMTEDCWQRNRRAAFVMQP
jgi:peptidoglycan-associated lipoprotein